MQSNAATESATSSPVLQDTTSKPLTKGPSTRSLHHSKSYARRHRAQAQAVGGAMESPSENSGDGQLSSPPAQPSQAAPEDTAPAAVPRGAWLMHAKRDGLWPPPAPQPPAQQPQQPAAPQLLHVSIELPHNHSGGGSGVPSPGACRGNSPRRIGASEVSHKRLVLLGSGALSSPRSTSGASKSTRGDELANARTMSARSLEAKLARTFAVARILDSKSCNRGVRKRSLKGLKVRRAHSKRDISPGGSPRAGDVRGGLGSPDSSAEGHTMSLQTAPAVLSGPGSPRVTFPSSNVASLLPGADGPYTLSGAGNHVHKAELKSVPIQSHHSRAGSGVGLPTSKQAVGLGRVSAGKPAGTIARKSLGGDAKSVVSAAGRRSFEAAGAAMLNTTENATAAIVKEELSTKPANQPQLPELGAAAAQAETAHPAAVKAPPALPLAGPSPKEAMMVALPSKQQAPAPAPVSKQGPAPAPVSKQAPAKRKTKGGFFSCCFAPSAVDEAEVAAGDFRIPAVVAPTEAALYHAAAAPAAADSGAAAAVNKGAHGRKASLAGLLELGDRQSSNNEELIKAGPPPTPGQEHDTASGLKQPEDTTTDMGPVSASRRTSRLQTRSFNLLGQRRTSKANMDVPSTAIKATASQRTPALGDGSANAQCAAPARPPAESSTEQDTPKDAVAAAASTDEQGNTAAGNPLCSSAEPAAQKAGDVGTGRRSPSPQKAMTAVAAPERKPLHLMPWQVLPKQQEAAGAAASGTKTAPVHMQWVQQQRRGSPKRGASPAGQITAMAITPQGIISLSPEPQQRPNRISVTDAAAAFVRSLSIADDDDATAAAAISTADIAVAIGVTTPAVKPADSTASRSSSSSPTSGKASTGSKTRTGSNAAKRQPAKQRLTTRAAAVQAAAVAAQAERASGAKPTSLSAAAAAHHSVFSMRSVLLEDAKEAESAETPTQPEAAAADERFNFASTGECGAAEADEEAAGTAPSAFVPTDADLELVSMLTGDSATAEPAAGNSTAGSSSSVLRSSFNLGDVMVKAKGRAQGKKHTAGRKLPACYKNAARSSGLLMTGRTHSRKLARQGKGRSAAASSVQSAGTEMKQGKTRSAAASNVQFAETEATPDWSSLSCSGQVDMQKRRSRGSTYLEFLHMPGSRQGRKASTSSFSISALAEFAGVQMSDQGSSTSGTPKLPPPSPWRNMWHNAWGPEDGSQHGSVSAACTKPTTRANSNTGSARSSARTTMDEDGLLEPAEEGMQSDPGAALPAMQQGDDAPEPGNIEGDDEAFIAGANTQLEDSHTCKAEEEAAPAVLEEVADNKDSCSAGATQTQPALATPTLEEVLAQCDAAADDDEKTIMGQHGAVPEVTPSKEEAAFIAEVSRALQESETTLNISNLKVSQRLSSRSGSGIILPTPTAAPALSGVDEASATTAVAELKVDADTAPGSEAAAAAEVEGGQGEYKI